MRTNHITKLLSVAVFVLASCSPQQKAKTTPEPVPVPPVVVDPLPVAEIEWYAGMGPLPILLAQQSERRVIVYFYSKSCHWCASMDRLTFANPRVVEAVNDRYVPIAVDVETDPVAAELGVKAVPFVVTTTSAFDVISATVGFQTPDQLLGVLGLPDPEPKLPADK